MLHAPNQTQSQPHNNTTKWPFVQTRTTAVKLVPHLKIRLARSAAVRRQPQTTYILMKLRPLLENDVYFLRPLSGRC